MSMLGVWVDREMATVIALQNSRSELIPYSCGPRSRARLRHSTLVSSMREPSLLSHLRSFDRPHSEHAVSHGVKVDGRFKSGHYQN